MVPIGEGNFSKVYSVVIDNKQYAVKQVNRLNSISSGDPSSFNHLDNVFNESVLLSKMQHPRIIKMYGKYRTEENYHFVLEHCNGGDLRSFLRTYNYQSGSLRIREPMA